MPAVAVIGAGISGLVAARELERAGHEVVVYEADERIGGHSNTVRVEDEAGRWDVDTGFIVFNDRNYPHFERLLSELGVETKAAPMSFGVSDGDGGFEWSMTRTGLFARHSHLFDPRFHRMLAELLRFFREARGLVGTNGDAGSLRSWLASRGYSDYFVERMIVPQVSAVWSADPDQLSSFPASFLAEFLANHGALQVRDRPQWRSIAGGSRVYVDALVRELRGEMRPATPVHALRRFPRHVEVSSHRGTESFDEVVIAVHSDQALSMLADPSDPEREILEAIPYQYNDVVLHTDISLMPRRRRAWASWNFHLRPDPAGATTVTYDMNRLQGLDAERRFLVTLNRGSEIDPAKVIRRLAYSHPVYTAEGVAAQARWAQISGRRRTHYCGAYWRWGFHEDGVWSAMRACEPLLGRAADPAVLGDPGDRLELAA